ncbi:MAG: polysaccharide deacetylase family protein [Bacteroidota bacterium]
MPYFHKTPKWLKRFYPSLIWDYSSKSEKTIYLTFDDGPIPEVTEFVLETLQEFNAHATFFCVGDNISKHPSIAQSIIEQGHTVGNHTYNHIKGWNTKNEAYFENISKCDARIDALGSSKKRLFRPPYGRIGPSQIRHLKNEYEIIMWDVLTGDYNASLTSEGILRNIIKATNPGSIVLFHDSLKAYPRMKKVLPAYLEHFSHRGYAFMAL